MRFLVVLLLITTFLACERNETEKHETTKNETRSDTLVIGDSSYCQVKLIESKTTGEEYKIISFPIDVDDDGHEDFVFDHYRKDKWGASYVNLKCTNDDSYVNVQRVLDTTYLQFLMDSIEYNDLFVINIMEILNCNKVNPYRDNRFDSIYEINNTHFIGSLDLEDTISQQDLWLSDTLQLSYSEYYWPSGVADSIIESDIKDTAIYKSSMKLLSCHLFPNDSVKFIGIKKGERLGWIKISVHYHCETIIHEIGLQK